MSDLQRQVLEDMGIDVWLPREHPGAAGSVAEESLSEDKDWIQLKNTVGNCHQCDLSKSRMQTVFGSGNIDADLLLIGEAPGAEEDRQGLPFVGKAGKLLDAMLFAIGFDRERVYICNVLKCRPPDNRNPQASEVDACAGFLTAQIDFINPTVILALGRFAAHSLLKTEAPVYKMRESQNFLPGSQMPVIVTYHPASLLRNPEQKAQAWQDLCKVKHLLEPAGD